MYHKGLDPLEEDADFMSIWEIVPNGKKKNFFFFFFFFFFIKKKQIRHFHTLAHRQRTLDAEHQIEATNRN